MDAKIKVLLTGVAVAVGAAATVHVLRGNSSGNSGGGDLAPSGYPMVLGTSGFDKFAQDINPPDIPNYLRDPTMYLTYNTPPWVDAQFGSAPSYTGGDTVIVGGASSFSYNSPMDMRSLTISGGDDCCCCDGCEEPTDGSTIMSFDPNQALRVQKAQGGYMNAKWGNWLNGNIIG